MSEETPISDRTRMVLHGLRRPEHREKYLLMHVADLEARVRDLKAAIREHREAYADNRWASGDVSNKLWAALGGAGEG